MATLGDLGDSVDSLAVPPEGDEVRRRSQIAVPHVMPHKLKMPDSLASRRVEGDQAIAEQILTDPVAAPKIEGR